MLLVIHRSIHPVFIMDNVVIDNIVHHSSLEKKTSSRKVVSSKNNVDSSQIISHKKHWINKNKLKLYTYQYGILPDDDGIYITPCHHIYALL